MLNRNDTPAYMLPNSDSDSGTNDAATVTLAANAQGAHVITGVLWSYDGSPTGGRLTISDGGTTKVDVDIVDAGPGSLDGPIVADRNSEVIVTLAAGGSGVVGKLTVFRTLTQ